MYFYLASGNEDYISFQKSIIMVEGWTSSIVKNIITTFHQLRQLSYPPSLPKLWVSCQCPAAPLNCLRHNHCWWKHVHRIWPLVKESVKFGQVWPRNLHGSGRITRGRCKVTIFYSICNRPSLAVAFPQKAHKLKFQPSHIFILFTKINGLDCTPTKQQFYCWYFWRNHSPASLAIITDFKFIGKVESTTNDFYKTSVLAHFTWKFFKNQ